MTTEFKPGDRVRCKANHEIEGEVDGTSRYEVEFVTDLGATYNRTHAELELAPWLLKVGDTVKHNNVDAGGAVEYVAAPDRDGDTIFVYRTSRDVVVAGLWTDDWRVVS